MENTKTNPPAAAAATVFAIAELREAILIAFAYANMERAGVNTAAPAPVTRLFPLQRISRAFSDTIRRCPRLRSLMCLDRGVGFISPVRWFLHTLNMTLWSGISFKHQEVMHTGYWTVCTGIEEEGKNRCAVPQTWMHKDASWRNISVYPEDYQESGIHLCFLADPSDPHGLDRDGRGEEHMKLAPEARPRLGDVYRFIEEIVRSCELLILKVHRLRAEENARREIESEKLRIAFYSEEINALYPRGSTPPGIRTEYKERYWAKEREKGRDFPAWQAAYLGCNIRPKLTPEALRVLRMGTGTEDGLSRFELACSLL